MQRIAVIARLKPGTLDRARELIAHGPPFDPEKLQLERHTVYVSDDQVVFVFEGGRVNSLIRTAEEGAGAAALAAWEPILDGIPRINQEVYRWERTQDPAWVGAWGE